VVYERADYGSGLGDDQPDQLLLAPSPQTGHS
jgi:hypothetical protein